MGTFYFIIAFIIVLGFYAYSNNLLKKDFVNVADCQSSRDLSRYEIKELSFYKKHKIYKDTKGNTINLNNMLHFVVSGESMRERGIRSGDEIFVLKIDKSKDLKEQIKRGDLLCIYLDEIGVYKIRALDCLEENFVLTYYYDENGNRLRSRYSSDNIIGIVKYKI